MKFPLCSVRIWWVFIFPNDYKSMEVKCKTNNTLCLSQLVEFQGNLKERTDGDFEKIAKSIKKHGFAFPFFVWKHDGINHVLDGHGRMGALKRMVAQGEHLPPLPVVYVNAKDEADAKELLLKLNSHYGKMSAESVRDFLGDLQIDFEDLALPEGVLDLDVHIEDVIKDTVGDDEAPEVNENEEPNSKPGEIYELGEHLLMCGDSTNEEDVARLMGGIQADLVVTDPPYNVNYQGKTGSKLKIENDKMGDEKFREFLKDAFTCMRDNMKDGAAFYIWYASSQVCNFQGACDDTGLIVRQALIWNKNSLVLSRQDYQWKHEPCLYGWKSGSGHAWYSDRKQTTVIDCKRPSKSTDHPTMKPVELFEYQIKNSSKAGDIVLDLFGGSGTTIIACAKTNRIARIMELDPHYCDVIRRRWTKWAKANGQEVGSGGLE